jgi:hypothetical protein
VRALASSSASSPESQLDSDTEESSLVSELWESKITSESKSSCKLPSDELSKLKSAHPGNNTSCSKSKVVVLSKSESESDVAAVFGELEDVDDR